MTALALTRDVIEGVLVIHAPPPLDRLDVERRILRVEEDHGTGPALAEGLARRLGFRGAGLAVSVDASTTRIGALEAGLDILATRCLEDLRHREGLVYSIDVELEVLNEEQSIATLDIEAGPDQAGRVIDRIMAVMSELADSGATAAEVDRVATELEEDLADPRAVGSILGWSAGGELITGGPVDPHARPGDIRRAGSAGVAEVMRQARDSLLVHTPYGTSDLPAYLRRGPGHRSDPEVTGRTHRRKLLSIAPLGLAVTVGDQGLSRRIRDEVITTPWEAIVGIDVQSELGLVSVVTGRMDDIFFIPRQLEGGDDLMRELRARVPSSVWRERPQDFFTTE